MSDKLVRLVLRVDEGGKFVGEIKKGDKALHDLGKTSGRTGREAQELGKNTDDLGRSLFNAERSASLLKVGLASLGIASVGALLSTTIESARGFSSALAEISTLLADTKNMAGFRRELQEMSIEFGKLPEAEAKALYQIISSGAQGAAEQMRLLRTANRLAVGGITDVATAADGLTSTLNAFGDAVGSSDDVSDKFFATMKGGKTTIAEISSSIGAVAPLAAQLDISLDEVLATVVAVTKGGDTTSKAMNGLKQAFAAIIKPSGEAQKLAAELGIEFNAASLATKGWSGFLDHLVEKTGASADQLAVLFGGTEALLPVLTLTGKGAENFAAALDHIVSSSGETGVAVAKVTEGLGAADHNLSQLTASLTVIATELGDPLINTLAPAAQAVADNLFEIVDIGSDLLKLLAGLLIAKATGTAFLFLQAQSALLATNLTFASFASGGMTASLIAQTAAAGSAAVAMRALSAASAFFGGPLGLTVAAASTAYVLLGSSTDLAQEATERMRASTALLSEEIQRGTIISRADTFTKLRHAQANQALARSNIRLIETEIARIKAKSQNVLGGQLVDAEAGRLQSLSATLEELLVDLDNTDANLASLREQYKGFTVNVTELGTAAGETGDALALTSEELTAYEKLLGTLDPIGTAVADYREAVHLLDKALATGSIPNQAEYNELLAALDKELASVLDQKPASEIRAWAAAQDDLTNATIANNAADKVWIENHKDAVQKLADYRAGLAQEIELNSLTQEQRDEELIVRDLLNLAKEAGVDLTEKQARAEAEAITVANRSAKEHERALNQNLDLYKRFIDEVEGGFKDAFKEAFRDGEGGFARLMDGFKNLFLDMLAELAFQAIAKPIIVPVLQQVGSSLFGLSGGQVNNVLSAQGLGGQGLGSIPGIGGNIQTGSGAGGFNISSLFSGGGGVAAFREFATGSLGQALGLSQVLPRGGAIGLTSFGGQAAQAFGRLSSFGGMAGAFGGNLLANALLGDRGIGASIGGTLGAVAGSFIPIPVLGPLIGSALGNAIGGLFGNNRPSVGQVIGGRFGGQGQVLGTGTDNGGSGSAAAEFSDQISTVIRRILDVTGASIENEFSIEKSQRNGLMVNRFANGGAQVFGDDLVAALQFALKGNTSGGDPVFEKLFSQSSAGSVEELVGLLESAKQFKATLDGLTAANDNLTAGEQAIKALSDQLDGLRKKAVEFGFDVSQIDIAEAVSRDRLASDFNENISSALLTALDPVRAQAVAMIEAQETRVRDTIALGGDLAQAEKLSLLERRDFLRRLTEEQRNGLSDLIDLAGDFGAQLAEAEQTLAASITTQFNSATQLARAYQAQATSLLRVAGALEAKRIDLRFGSTSALSPLQQLNEARTIMNDLTTRAFDGGETGALAELPAAVQRFVEASAAYNADNGQFVSDFNDAQELLASAAELATTGADAALSQVDLLTQQSDLLAEILTTLNAPSPDAALLQSQLDRLTDLNGQLARDLTVNVDGFDAFLTGQAQAETLLGQLVTLASTDLNQSITTQAQEIAAKRIADIETASAKAVADARASAQTQIDAAIARATAAETAALEAKAQAETKYENSLAAAVSSEHGRMSLGRAGGYDFDNRNGINQIEASRISQTENGRLLAFLNPARLLAMATDIHAENALRKQFHDLGVPGFAGGGEIGGIGTGTSDSNLIFGSRGEFVIQSAAVNHYGVDFFKALNAGKVNAAPANDRGQDLNQLAAGLVEVRDAVVMMGDAVVAAVEDGTGATHESARAIKQSVVLMQRRAL